MYLVILICSLNAKIEYTMGISVERLPITFITESLPPDFKAANWDKEPPTLAKPAKTDRPNSPVGTGLMPSLKITVKKHNKHPARYKDAVTAKILHLSTCDLLIKNENPLKHIIPSNKPNAAIVFTPLLSEYVFSAS